MTYRIAVSKEKIVSGRLNGLRHSWVAFKRQISSSWANLRSQFCPPIRIEIPQWEMLKTPRIKSLIMPIQINLSLTSPTLCICILNKGSHWSPTFAMHLDFLFTKTFLIEVIPKLSLWQCCDGLEFVNFFGDWFNDKILLSNPKNGGHDWDWTSDPYDVNIVLSRWATPPRSWFNLKLSPFHDNYIHIIPRY